MRHLAATLAILSLLTAAPARADRAGDFDYYVMALSWQPNWCAAEGDARAAEACRPGRGHGWLLHGLWPQHERGYPAYCEAARRDPSRRQMAAMADLMGSSGSAWHQWKKHGRCSGLSARDYFALSRLAYDGVTRPALLRRLDQTVALPAVVVEEAFLEANLGLEPDMLTVTCRDGRIAEVRLCLTRSLEPRVCGADIRRDCAATDALFAPIR